MNRRLLVAIAVALMVGILAMPALGLAAPSQCPHFSCTDLTSGGVTPIRCPNPLNGTCYNVHWTTRSETDIVGFNVIFLDCNKGTRTQSNTFLIACSGCTDGSSQSYSFVATQKPNDHLRYYIEVVHVFGGTTTCGPV